jgi:hypothetical protein
MPAYNADTISANQPDGVGLAFPGWRFNLRSPNTQTLVRLNVKAKGASIHLMKCNKSILELLGKTSAHDFQ